VTRRIEITLMRSKTTVVAELLDHRAPRTCDAIWASLKRPVERLALHGMATGENVFFYNFAPVRGAATLPLENQITRAVAGNILFFYRANITFSGADEIPEEWGLRRGDDVYELVFCYGRTDETGPAINGWVGRHIANIVTGLEEFQHACRMMRIDGAQPLRLRRLDEGATVQPKRAVTRARRQR
jgi:hypothetical protein